MIVYRLEDRDGYGFWSGYEGTYLLEGHSGLWEGGCSVNRWSLPRSSSCYRFGCDSLETLKKYFGTAWDDIMASGKLEVAQYKIRKSKTNVFWGANNKELCFLVEKSEKISAPTLEKVPKSPFGMGQIVLDEAATVDWGALIKMRMPTPRPAMQFIQEYTAIVND